MKKYSFLLIAAAVLFLSMDILFSHSKVGVGTVIKKDNAPHNYNGNVIEPILPSFGMKQAEVFNGKEIVVVYCHSNPTDAVIFYRIVCGGITGAYWSITQPIGFKEIKMH